MIRSDFIVAAVIVALAAFAVVKQLEDPSPDEPPIAVVEIGEVIDPMQTITLIGTPPFEDTLGPYLGKRATVLYTWSIPCPCTDKVDGRLRAIYAQHGPRQGVEWLAIDGEPLDKPADVLSVMGRTYAFYKMILDPEQRLIRQLGAFQAVQMAILDSEGRLRYVGAIDDDYEEGKGQIFRQALEAVLAGEPVPEARVDGFYGCAFNDPASCEEYEEPEAAEAATTQPAVDAPPTGEPR
jgi:hypothetical protein